MLGKGFEQLNQVKIFQNTWLNNDSIAATNLSDSMSSSVAGLEYDLPFYPRSAQRSIIIPCHQLGEQHASVKLQVDKLSFENGPISSKLVHMKLCSHLKATVMAGLVEKYRGAGKYLLDEDLDTYHIVRTIRVRIVGRKVELDEEPDESKGQQATHFVAAMKHGAEAFITFQRYLTDGVGAKKTLERQMDEILEDFVNCLRNNTEPDQPWGGDLRGRFYGDLHTQSRDCSLFEAIKLVREMMDIIESDPSRAVPVTVWLSPMDKSTDGIRDVDEGLLGSAENILNKLAKLKATSKTLLTQEDQLELFPHLADSLHSFSVFLDRQIQHLRSEFHRQIPAIRLGKEEEADLLRNHLGEFSTVPAIFNGWLKDKVGEFQALRAISNIAQQKQMPLVQSQEELDEILLSTNTKWILALGLPSVSDIANPFARKDLQEVLEIIKEDSARNELRKGLMKTARRMFQQAERSGNQVGFILTSLLPSPFPYQPTLTLFENGEQVASNFLLPEQPENVRLILTGDSPVLEWDCDQRKDVLHFVVHYKRTGQESQWIACNTSGPVTSFKFKLIKDPSGYQFRVASTSLIGCGEFSRIVEGPAANFSSTQSDDVSPAADKIKFLEQRIVGNVNSFQLVGAFILSFGVCF